MNNNLSGGGSTSTTSFTQNPQAMDVSNPSNNNSSSSVNEIIPFRLKPHSSLMYTSSLSTFAASALAPASAPTTSSGSSLLPATSQPTTNSAVSLDHVENYPNDSKVERPSLSMPLAYRNSFGGKINLKYRYVYVCSYINVYTYMLTPDAPHVFVYV